MLAKSPRRCRHQSQDQIKNLQNRCQPAADEKKLINQYVVVMTFFVHLLKSWDVESRRDQHSCVSTKRNLDVQRERESSHAHNWRTLVDVDVGDRSTAVFRLLQENFFFHFFCCTLHNEKGETNNNKLNLTRIQSVSSARMCVIQEVGNKKKKEEGSLKRDQEG